MSSSELRRTLRNEGRRARAELCGEDRRIAEQRLGSHLGSLMLPAGGVIGGYIASDGEPDIGPWLESRRRDGYVVALPVPTGDADAANMAFLRWHDADELTPGRYGIPCPPGGADRGVVPDLVLVPTVRFDAAGNRLGRGAGYYDRWLAGRRSETVGVAFECQRAGWLPAEAHDVPLGAVVTELGVRFITGAAAKKSGQCRVQGDRVDKDVLRCE